MARTDGHVTQLLLHPGLSGGPSLACCAQVKQAYRRLALRSHPDVNKSPGAEEAFTKIADAYSLLSDTKKRAELDGGRDLRRRGRH